MSKGQPSQISNGNGPSYAYLTLKPHGHFFVTRTPRGGPFAPPIVNFYNVYRIWSYLVSMCRSTYSHSKYAI